MSGLKGVRYIVGSSAASAVTSASVFWLRPQTEDTPERREEYAKLAAQDNLWVHEDPAAAWAAIDRRIAEEMAAFGHTRGWEPQVFRVEIGIEPVPRP